jgi:hypothetical protein
MNTRANHTWEAAAREWQAAGAVQGWGVDDETRTITFFVVADEPLPAFPSDLDGYAVVLIPLPRAAQAY